MSDQEVVERGLLKRWSGVKRPAALLGLAAAAVLMAGCGYPGHWKAGSQDGDRLAQAHSSAGPAETREVVVP